MEQSTVLINPTAAADHLRNSGKNLSDTALQAAIKDRIESIKDNAEAKCLGIISYVKRSGRDNALKSVVLLRLINSIDRKHNTPNFQFIAEEAQDEVDRLRMHSKFLKRAVFNEKDNLIHQPNHAQASDDEFTATIKRLGGIGKLGMIWHGRPTWAKPVPGNEYLTIKVRGMEFHYLDLLEQLGEQRPYFRKYLPKLQAILKLPVEQTIGMQEAELWMLL